MAYGQMARGQIVRGQIAVGLDLGTTKICAVIAEQVEEGWNVIGVGNAPSEGLKRGVVVDVEGTVAGIRRALDEAQLMAGLDVEAVFAGIAGEHISSLNSRGVIGIGGRGAEIGPEDRARVIEAARAVAIPFDREVLHVLPQEFVVDDQRGIRDPVGMSGVRLETSVHIVTGAATAAQNITKSIERAGVGVRGLLLEPLASGRAVLQADEREMGVCLVDIGGGTTDVAFYTQGGVRHTAVIGIGGQNVTNDVALCLRTSMAHAELVKREFGMAVAAGIDPGEMVEMPGIAGRDARQVARGELAAIIEARMEEVFSMVAEQIVRSGAGQELGAGIVLTGGGALLEGVVELAESVLDMPVRLGAPSGLGGVGERVASPIYATALGLVLMGAETEGESGGTPGESGESLWTRLLQWLKEYL
jgi:cell division protein FtsA